MYPQAIGPIPAETARIARAANPKGTLAMWLRDELGAIYSDEEFADVYPERGQPALAPWRLALVTLVQYVEDLPDRQAAEAVRTRLDWKYLLGLELTDPGFDASVLCEFRQRLAVRSLHHLETVGETVRAVLEELAQVACEWLVSWMPQEWFKRSEGRMDSRRLPKKEAERRRLAEQIGRDGTRLMRALAQADTPDAARELESVQVLRQVWPQYYEEREGQVYWRDGPAQGAQQTIVSPYDTDARLAQKRDTAWCGYKVHVTETCEADWPELIVQVKTQLSPQPDVKDTLGLPQELERRQLLPEEHLVDGGYLESEVLVQHPPGLRIIGPVPPDTSWQAQEGTGSDVAHFQLDWAAQTATCPQGQQSRSWRERPEREGQIQVSFAKATCQACPVRTLCT